MSWKKQKNTDLESNASHKHQLKHTRQWGPQKFVGIVTIVVSIWLSASIFTVPTTPVAQAQAGFSQRDADRLGDAAEAVGDFAEDAWDWATSGNENNDVTTFTDFKGGLNAPSGENLDPTLTRARSVREFVINVVNFILGFLGLAAVIVIIYAGILYLTAAGNEDNTGKAKNAVKYAVIGIVLITASYAIVNTLITYVGSGESDRTDPSIVDSTGVLRGSANRTGIADGTINSQGRVYSIGAVEIQSAMNELLAAYKTLASISSIFTKINNLEPPETVGEYRSYLAQISNWVSEIRNKTAPLSKTHLAADSLLNEFFSRFNSMSNEKLAELYPSLTADGKKTADGGIKLSEEVKGKLLLVLAGPPENDFTAVIENLIGPIEAISEPIEQPVAGEKTTGRIFLIWKILGPAASDTQATNPQFRNLVDEKEVQKAFAGIDPSSTVGELFIDAIKKVKKLSEINVVKIQTLPGEEAPDATGNNATNARTFIEAMQSLSRLHLVIKTIKFVDAVITANVTQGNAPLTVELSALSSRDPDGVTIPDDKYTWDPDGDGTEGLTENGDSVNCEGNDTGPVISCTYNKPGTYLVRLQVASTHPDRVSNGMAYFPIVVRPSLAHVVLKATTNGVEETLRQYERTEDGIKKLIIEKTQYQITNEEGKRGVIFNAQESKGANNAELKEWLWNFGDGSPTAKGSSVPHIYAAKGRYPFSLEVTDRSNRKDRVTLTVFVGSIAARIIPSKNIAGAQEIIEFDGSTSHSDNGPINSYAWKILAQEATTPSENGSRECIEGDITAKTACIELIGTDSTSPRLQAKFKQPGIYTVELTVTDARETATYSIPVQIKSRQPRGTINMHACPDDCPVEGYPGIIEFDSAGSFDPDTHDVLSYSWGIFNAVGDPVDPGSSTYQILTTDSSATATQREGLNGKVLRIKFARAGAYKIRLIVNDGYTDSRIRQEHLVEKYFEVDSTIGLAWDEAMQTAAQLENNRAIIVFKGSIENAQQAEIDFGDGESKEINVRGSPFALLEEHTYDQAKEYIVTLRAFSDTNGEYSVYKRVIIAPGNEPRAIIRIFEDENEIVLPETIDTRNPEQFEVIRGVRLMFDASQSIASNGSQNPQQLLYSWDFGDGDTSTKEKVTHTYDELTNDEAVTFITLTVSEKNNPSKKHTTQFPLRVISSKPLLTALTVEKQSAGNETPVDVIVRAEGARDIDGRVTNYTFWYYHPSNPDEKLSVLDTSSNQASLTLETFGNAGEENEFIFCVELTDSDNSTATCDALIDENRRPRVSVKNGPNKAPKAAFEVQPSTTVRVNEEITFTSSATDEDGEIMSYIWDLEGDGFQNNNPTTASSITHTYSKKSTASGYKVKLKVIDDKNAAGYSREIPVIVTTPSNPPRANFRYEADRNIPLRIKFFDASTPDEQNLAQIAEWHWDFDTSQEFGCTNDNRPSHCNGDKTDDNDSEDQFPVFDFPTTGRYQVMLTVVDNFDTESSITQFIEVRGGAVGETSNGGTVSRPRSQSAQADLKAYYANRFAVAENQQKVLRIPTNACRADVAFYWGDSRANDVPLFMLDKNIYHDSNGDGNRTNDYQDVYITNECTIDTIKKNNCTVLSFNRFDQQTNPRGSGQFETELSMAIEPQSGTTRTIIDKDSVKIVFERTNNAATELTPEQCQQGGNIFGASLFKDIGLQNSLIYSVIGGIIIAAALYGFRTVGLKGTMRTDASIHSTLDQK